VFALGRTSLHDELFGLFDNRFVRRRVRLSVKANEEVAGVPFNDGTQHMVIIISKRVTVYDDGVDRRLAAGFEAAVRLMKVPTS